MSMVFLVICLFGFFEALNDAFELHFFQGFRHWTLNNAFNFRMRGLREKRYRDDNVFQFCLLFKGDFLFFFKGGVCRTPLYPRRPCNSHIWSLETDIYFKCSIQRMYCQISWEKTIDINLIDSAVILFFQEQIIVRWSGGTRYQNLVRNSKSTLFVLVLLLLFLCVCFWGEISTRRRRSTCNHGRQ